MRYLLRTNCSHIYLWKRSMNFIFFVNESVEFKNQSWLSGCT